MFQIVMAPSFETTKKSAQENKFKNLINSRDDTNGTVEKEHQIGNMILNQTKLTGEQVR